jgi:type IV pilus assembly protein PilN
MIRINLLPFRAARKRENIRRQISIYALVVIFIVLVLGYYTIHLKGTVSDLRAKEKQANTELASYKKVLDEIKALEGKIKEIKTKLDVIKELEKGKTGPVLLLADVADSVPENKLWLTSYSESEGTLDLTGTAMDNETVALFMNNLENTERINSVDLKSATLRDLQEYNLKVSDFALTCETYAHKEKKPADTKKAKKRK